ncbi:TetR family transcriptional regulator [Sphingomonas quercus]|uniref:TetR family transcriptional regulator n=1 Tax=Sphingomonas quercus TaxID=2842451 RepID=A0ABS6BH01_9SPHN|nr:TetR family transcriptional regulator [Sphingomonas quercus]MBU3077583.1 TetR family transcriptional regulator [Sphingomonas quercus]
MTQWTNEGGAGISARRLSQIANVPASSIYHHFGSLEQLLLVAQEGACDAAALWCEARLDEMAGPPIAANGFAAAFAALIDEWAVGQRGLAFAWRECQLLGMRDPRFRPISQRWSALWSNFWARFGGHVGLADHARLTQYVFDSESYFHMFRWRRVVDRAGLDEFCRGWGAWLTGLPAPPSPWRDFARLEAMRGLPPLPDRDETTARIAAAAATVIARAGTAGLTHRAVAAEADLTLGVVSHKFRTVADLLRAAFETIYIRSAGASERDPPPTPRGSREELLRQMAGLQQRSATDSGVEDLFIAVARDPALHQFAAQLRYRRGHTSGAYLRALVAPGRVVSSLDAALFSAFMTGQIRARRFGIECAPGEKLAQLMALIDRP